MGVKVLSPIAIPAFAADSPFSLCLNGEFVNCIVSISDQDETEIRGLSDAFATDLWNVLDLFLSDFDIEDSFSLQYKRGFEKFLHTYAHPSALTAALFGINKVSKCGLSIQDLIQFIVEQELISDIQFKKQAIATLIGGLSSSNAHQSYRVYLPHGLSYSCVNSEKLTESNLSVLSSFTAASLVQYLSVSDFKSVQKLLITSDDCLAKWSIHTLSTILYLNSSGNDGRVLLDNEGVRIA